MPLRNVGSQWLERAYIPLSPLHYEEDEEKRGHVRGSY